MHDNIIPCICGNHLSECEFVSEKFLSVNNCGSYECRHTNQSSQPRKRKDHMFIFFVSGGGYATLNGEKIPVKENDLIYFKPQTQINFSGDFLSCHYWIHFSGNRVEELLIEAKINDSGIYSLDNTKRVVHILNKICYRIMQTNDIHDLFCQGLFLELLDDIKNNRTNITIPNITSSKIQPALAEISSSYGYNYNLEHYAKICKMSLSSFKTTFKKLLNISPNLYITKIRIDSARIMLTNSDLSIAEIAKNVGYDDQFYFSRTFKKHIGISPKDYRDQYKKKVL